MNNVELAKKVEGYLKGSAAKAKKFEDLVAVTISLISDTNEDMYVTVRDGKILVDHYVYEDNNCAVEASAEIIDKMFSGDLAFDKALADGSVLVKSGDPAKLKALECLVPSKKTASKTAAKKADDKKAAPKAAEKMPAPAAKPEAPKAEAPKPEEKKAAPAPAAKPVAPAAAAKTPAPAKNKGKKK